MSHFKGPRAMRESEPGTSFVYGSLVYIWYHSLMGRGRWENLNEGLVLFMGAWFISDVTLQGPDARELIRQTHSIQNVPLTSHSSHTEICSQIIRILYILKKHFMYISYTNTFYLFIYLFVNLGPYIFFFRTFIYLFIYFVFFYFSLYQGYFFLWMKLFLKPNK